MYVTYRDEEKNYEKEFDVPNWVIVATSLIISLASYAYFC